MIVPFPYSSVDQMLQHLLKEFADKDAIITVDPTNLESESLTYQKLINLVYKSAQFLVNEGFQKGDRLAILMSNCAEILIFELAAALIGATIVPLDSKRDTLDRKLFKLKETSAKTLLVKNDQDESESEQILKELTNLKVVSWGSFEEFEKLLPEKITFTPQSGIESDQLVLYTSGTTSLPKGAVLSLEACLLNAMGIIEWQGFDSSDRFNVVLPLHHINSTIFCLTMIISGGTIILNTHYSASKFWEIVSKFQVTNSSIVPTILHDLLVRYDEFKDSNLRILSLKRICIGSAPVLPAETLKFVDLFKIRMTQGYGQTETALRVSGVPVNLDEQSYRKIVELNSIGVSLINNELEIMDNENKPKKEGEEGEICIKGEVLASEYLNDPIETAKAFKNGWFHSGDLGYWKNIEGRRYFFMIGRLKEIIIKGGINISPSAVEDALLNNFAEIEEVSVVGYPDLRMGEEIAAAVVVKTGVNIEQLKQKILNACQNEQIKGLSAYELPKKIFTLSELPKTSTGKIQRVEVKKMIQSLMENEKKGNLYVRLIKPTETDVLVQITKINNQRWEGLPATTEQFQKRAANGFLWAVFDEQHQVLGSLSGLRLDQDDLDEIKTWDQVTSGGTLEKNNPNGDILLCVAISTKTGKIGNEIKNNIDETKLKSLAGKKIEQYVNSDLDHVLNFHKKSKAGVKGAEVYKILEDGRTEDKSAMGYNVLMRYPDPKSLKVVRSNQDSPSNSLIAQAMIYAKNSNLKSVVAFSRPMNFREYLIEENFLK